jgi:hypothetical protein
MSGAIAHNANDIKQIRIKIHYLSEKALDKQISMVIWYSLISIQPAVEGR